MATTRVKPGLAFSIICDRGFAIGLYTHKHLRLGELVWLADGFWDEEPTASDVANIRSWRWCVFFPLGAAVRRGLVTPIADVAIPAELVEFPTLRNGSKRQGWFRLQDGDLNSLDPTTDASLPIAMLVNDTRLKEMLVTGWEPEDVW